MASSSRIHLSPENTGLLSGKVIQSVEVAEKASFLLQEDLEKHHVFHNNIGLYNHTQHHILALYATGAPSSLLQQAYEYNESFQRPLDLNRSGHEEDSTTASSSQKQPQPDVSGSGSSGSSVSFQSWDQARPFLGKGKEDDYYQTYSKFLRFFQEEISKFMVMSKYDQDWGKEILTRYLFNSPPPSARKTFTGAGTGDEGDHGDHSGTGEDMMLIRLFAGLLHPAIELMYGLEFNQPAIIAEALAQTAVHGNIDSLGSYLLECEERARTTTNTSSPSSSSSTSSASSSTPSQSTGRPSIIDLFHEAMNNTLLQGAAEKAAIARAGRSKPDPTKMYDCVIGPGNEHVKEELVQIASRVGVSSTDDEREIERMTVEMFNTLFYVASTAAFRDGETEPKFDFGLIHNVNASPVCLILNSKSWISPETKARILEWKIRMDLLQYVIRGCPSLDGGVEKIASYTSRSHATRTTTSSNGQDPNEKKEEEEETCTSWSWSWMISRLHEFKDDGHAIKLGRAALICREATMAFLNSNTPSKEDAEVGNGKNPILMIDTEDMWDKIFHLIVDSVESPGPTWVRGWKYHVPDGH